MTSASAAGPTRRGRPPKGSTQLSRDAIVTATLQVIDADGISAVSMRTVARALGVDAKSLYNHVDGKDGLLDAVAENLLGSIAIPRATGDAATDLRGIADAFRARALAHPEAASLVLTRQLTSIAGLAPVEALLAVLRDAGCPVDESVRLLRVLVAAIIGTLLREVHAGPTFGATDAEGRSTRRDALERTELPHIVEAAAELAHYDRDAEFRFAVDAAIEITLHRVAHLGG
ncbi:TetR/AcrR family transcriptional regulator C-terminal domain-containing protein [Gordonia sp. NPDC003585]|uniref:TetR/AcrR family transcriptional regulator n=1 Tax=Gordonia sp. NPDC003585 TaxID=3154275 RepID=UPI0033B016E3